MTISEVALSQVGIAEVVGELHNPEVLKYFTEIGQDWVTTDETAWCSAFVNWCAQEAGQETSGKLNARSWLTVGEEVIDPRPGDIAIFWRESKNSWKGHVAIYCNTVGDYIHVLGGNQRNRVCIQPYHKKRILQYRRLTNY